MHQTRVPIDEIKARHGLCLLTVFAGRTPRLVMFV